MADGVFFWIDNPHFLICMGKIGKGLYTCDICIIL
jgi:hypothetical protein